MLTLLEREVEGVEKVPARPLLMLPLERLEEMVLLRLMEPARPAFRLPPARPPVTVPMLRLVRPLGV